MAERAEIAKVKAMVYENLGITDRTQSGGYGTLLANKRYPSAFIDDAIMHADLQVMTTLLRSKQYNFSEDFFDAVNIPDGFPFPLPTNCEMLSVYFFYNPEGAEYRADEITWETYQALYTTGMGSGTLYPNTSAEGEKYGGYYTVKDHKIHQIPFPGIWHTLSSASDRTGTLSNGVNTITLNAHGLVNGNVVKITGGTVPTNMAQNTPYYVVQKTDNTFKLSATLEGSPITFVIEGDFIQEPTITLTPIILRTGYVRYISLTHPNALSGTDLQSPEGFEDAVALFASAQLLMKRSDQPEQANFYLQQYQSLMQNYMTPSSNASRSTDR